MAMSSSVNLAFVVACKVSVFWVVTVAKPLMITSKDSRVNLGLFARLTSYLMPVIVPLMVSNLEQL